MSQLEAPGRSLGNPPKTTSNRCYITAYPLGNDCLHPPATLHSGWDGQEHRHGTCPSCTPAPHLQPSTRALARSSSSSGTSTVRGSVMLRKCFRRPTNVLWSQRGESMLKPRGMVAILAWVWAGGKSHSVGSCLACSLSAGLPRPQEQSAG